MGNISIIMPLFNAEKYLTEALESILGQTFKEFELICVNDASTDNTLYILEEFRLKDSRIKVISNDKQSGAAESRNRGIKEAKGEYLTFLDGDDIFDSEMLYLAYNTIEYHQADVVMYEYMHVSSEHIYEKKVVPRSEQYIKRYCMVPFCLKDLYPMESVGLPDSPWDKLYRRSFLLENKLEFQNLPSCNDVFFVTMVLMLAKKAIVLNDRRVLVYARDHFTPTRISYDRDPMCVYEAMERVEEELIQRNMFCVFFQHYYYKLFFELRNALFVNKSIEKTRKFYDFLQEEGIKALFDMDGKYYLNIHDSIKQLLINFQTRPFEDEWYMNLNWGFFNLKKYSYKIVSTFNNYKAQNKKVAIWGIGKKGELLLKLLEECNIKIEAAVDRDKNKIGKQCCGYIIQIPEDVFDHVQVIIASAHFIYQEIKKELADRELEIVDYTEIVRHLQDE